IVIDSLSIEPREVGPPAIVGLLTFDVPRLDELESTIAAARGLPDDEGEPTSYGSVRGSVALSPGRRALPSGVIDLRGEDVVVAGVRIGAVTAEIDADDDRLVVRELSARDPGRARIDGAGTFTFDSRAFSETRLTVLLDEPAVYAEGLDVLGDVSAVAEVSGTLDDLEGWIRARAGRIERGARSIGDAEFDARIDGRTIDVDRISANTDFGAIEAAGRVDLPVGGAPLDALLESLTLERDDARLALADSVRIVVDGERIRIEDLRLEGSGGQIELDVDTRSDAGVRVVGDVRTLRLRPFLEEILGDSADLGVLNGALTFESEPLRASVDAQLDGVAVAGSETPIQARVEATWLDDRVELKALSAQLQNLDVELAGSAPLTLDGDALGDGPVSFAGSARVDAAALGSGLASAFVPASVARTLSGAAELRLNVSGTWSGLVGRVGAEVKSFDVLDTSGTPVEWLPGTVSGTVAVEAGPDDTRVTVALDGDGLARLEGDAILSRTLDVRATIADPTAWLDAALAGEARLESTDLAWLSDLSPNLRETSGRLVIGGRVEGSLRELAPTGNVRLERGKVRYRGAPIVDELELSAAVTPDRATIESCRFTVGAAPVVVKGGAALDGPTPRVELSVTGDEVLLFRSSDARIRANVDLGVTGPLDGLRVAGDVALVGGRFRSPVEFESILAGGRGAPTSVRRGIRLPAFGPETVALDVGITTADPMRLDGRLTRGKIRADLRLKGSASQPIPSGRLFVDPLEVAVPAGRIEFTTGLVTFPPSQPEIPVLDLVGRTRLAGYDVTVNVEGDYDEAIVDFSSSPPLPPDDLLLLVLSGRTPNTGGSAEVAGQQVALYVAKDLLQGWLSSGGFDDDDRESFLERIEVITGRDVSRAGLLTIEATYKLKDGLVRERDVLYLAGERDAYEDYNFGLRIVLRLR
ncbi:MAG: translocation/assembly module TamB domain-containing protein, partial [Planctomycetota bacterium]